MLPRTLHTHTHTDNFVCTQTQFASNMKRFQLVQQLVRTSAARGVTVGTSRSGFRGGFAGPKSWQFVPSASLSSSSDDSSKDGEGSLESVFY
jgi:hypothetical protein